MALQSQAIDRQKTAPFHLKLFYKTNGFHSLSDFSASSSPAATQPLPPHLQIYTWPTLTLRELSHLLLSALPALLPSPAIGTRLAYKLVFPDAHGPPPPNIHGDGPIRPGRFLSKDLGSIVLSAPEGPGEDISAAESMFVGANSPAGGRLDGEPSKTLADARFVIGDYVDVAILPPGPDGSVAPVPVSTSFESGRRGGRGGYGGGRGPRENGYGDRDRDWDRERGGGRGRPMYNGAGGGPGNDDMRGGGCEAGRLEPEGVPVGEWRRGERLPESGYGSGGGRGGYRGGRARGY